MSKLPKIGFLYMDYVLRFFDYSNFKGWPEKIETVWNLRGILNNSWHKVNVKCVEQ